MMEIIDIHAHIFPDALAKRAGVSVGTFYELPPCELGSLHELLVCERGAGISQCVICNVALSDRQVPSINRFIAQSCQEYPDFLSGFGTMCIDYPDMEAELTKMRQEGLLGVKVHPDMQKFLLDSDASIAMCKRIADHGLPMLVHTGDYRYPYSRPERVARLLDAVPSLQIICAHLGGWSIWSDAVSVLAGHDRIWVDTSSSLYQLSPEEAVAIIRAYGVQRVLFGTDFPMFQPQMEVERFLALPLNETEKNAILYKNAKRLLDN